MELTSTASGSDGGRILIDVSTVWASRKSQPTGIPRVEFEVAARLIADGATGVIWDPDGQGFLAVDQGAFEGLFLEHRRYVDLNDVYLAPPGPNVRWRAAKFAGLAIFAALRPLTNRLSGRRSRLTELAARLYGSLAPAMPSVDRRRWSWLLGFNSNGWAATAAVRAFIETLRSNLHASLQGRVVAFRADDALLLIGASWEFLDLRRIEALKMQHGFKVVSLIYDLVPIRHPEWQPVNDDFTPRFRRAIDGMIKLGDRITAISQFVASDMERYAEEQGLGKISVRPVPLCSEIAEGLGATPSPRLNTAGLANGGFALFVSTLSPRKDHAFAYQLWRRLWTDRGDALPPLVFAGSRGWLSGDLLTLMTRDVALWGRKLIFIEQPSDAELAWLYRHCAFTIYPSRYEGWGLPITESLALGKYCLAADNTSLREASQGLAFHAEPFDGARWEEEVRRVLDEPGYLAKREADIAARFMKRNWSEVGADLLAEAGAARPTASS